GRKQQPAAPAVGRDFGAVNLSRSFEQNRLRLAQDVPGQQVETEQPKALAHIKTPITDMKPTQAVLQREKDHDLVARFNVLHGGGQANRPLDRGALPLWAAWGTARVEGFEDEQGKGVALVWDDGQTRCALRFPASRDQPLELRAEDARGSKDLAGRAAAAV